jgi:hypothetical protein
LGNETLSSVVGIFAVSFSRISKRSEVGGRVKSLPRRHLNVSCRFCSKGVRKKYSACQSKR